MTTSRSGNRPGTKKKTSTQSSNRKASTRKNTKAYQEQINFVKKEIIIITILAIAVLLFLCNFGIIGTVGDKVSTVMFGIFGLTAYVVPIVLFVAVAFGISNQGNPLAIFKLISCIILFFVFGSFCEMFTDTVHNLDALSVESRNFQTIIVKLYQESSANRNGGGVLSGGVYYALYSILSWLGALISLVVVTIICIVVITGKSFIGSVKKGGQKVYQTAKEDANRRRERAELRQLEFEQELLEEEIEEVSVKGKKPAKADKTKLRMNNKVSGVMIDTTLSEKEKVTTKNNDVHEIMLQDFEPLNQEEMNFDHIHVHSLGAEPKSFMETKPFIEPKPFTEPKPSMEEVILPNIKIHNEQNRDSQKEQQIEISPKVEKTKSNLTNENKSNSVEKEQPLVVDSTSAPKFAKAYKFPSLQLLAKGAKKGSIDSEKHLKETAMRLQQTLQTFGVKVTITDISQGPAVTRYELQPEQGVKVSKIVGLTDDIKLNLAATDIRIEAPIPGKAAVGIEVPNKENSAVALRDLLETKDFNEFSSNLAFAVGKNISGQTVVADIAKMPHMLIAGATGSGKSVCINTLIMSILYKAHPDDVKLIMIDPKVVELSVYNGIPHLLIPVVTDPKKASAALHWGVAEMTERYQKFADFNVRDLKGYNKTIEGKIDEATGQPYKKMPQVVIIVDELADLMMVAPGEVEESICRLAQLARAAGIHLIIATQRPSVDVITGLIKANMPSRVAFSVSSGVDSRTILDMNGAEKLLGKGDMLFYPQGYSKPARVQGAFVSDKEVADVVDFLKNQAIGNVYSDDIEEKISAIGTQGSGSAMSGGKAADERDMYFADAGKFIIEKDKASIGMIQRVFKVGFNRAARIMDQLAEAGVVGEEEGTKPRKVLMSQEEFENYIEEYI